MVLTQIITSLRRLTSSGGGTDHPAPNPDGYAVSVAADLLHCDINDINPRLRDSLNEGSDILTRNKARELVWRAIVDFEDITGERAWTSTRKHG